jgi:hypothetical protein
MIGPTGTLYRNTKVILKTGYRHTINGITRRHFGKEMTKARKLRIRSLTENVTLKFGSEAWVMKIGDEQRLEATQMKFLRHLLGITKLDRERHRSVWDKLPMQSTVRETEEHRQSGYNIYRE